MFHLFVNRTALYGTFCVRQGRLNKKKFFGFFLGYIFFNVIIWTLNSQLGLNTMCCCGLVDRVAVALMKKRFREQCKQFWWYANFRTTRVRQSCHPVTLTGGSSRHSTAKRERALTWNTACASPCPGPVGTAHHRCAVCSPHTPASSHRLHTQTQHALTSAHTTPTHFFGGGINRNCTLSTDKTAGRF